MYARRASGIQKLRAGLAIYTHASGIEAIFPGRDVIHAGIAFWPERTYKGRPALAINPAHANTLENVSVTEGCSMIM